MRGVVFLTVDHTISWRSKDTLDENPSFVRDNYHFILQSWPFDTEDDECMRRVLSAFSNLKLSQREVLDFAKSIGLDIASLKQAR